MGRSRKRRRMALMLPGWYSLHSLHRRCIRVIHLCLHSSFIGFIRKIRCLKSQKFHKLHFHTTKKGDANSVALFVSSHLIVPMKSRSCSGSTSPIWNSFSASSFTILSHNAFASSASCIQRSRSMKRLPPQACITKFA